jgi:hypothetical protein
LLGALAMASWPVGCVCESLPHPLAIKASVAETPSHNVIPELRIGPPCRGLPARQPVSRVLEISDSYL